MAARRRRAAETPAPEAPAPQAIVVAATPVAVEPAALKPSDFVPGFALTLAQLEAFDNELKTYEAVVFSPTFALQTAEQEEWATNVAHRAQSLEKHWEARRVAEVKPFNAVVKTVNNSFTPRIERAEALKKACGVALAVRADAKEAIRHQELEAAKEAYLAGDMNAATQALTTMNALGGKGPEGVSVGKKWVARIVHPDLVPRDWCVPDEKRINAHARLTNAGATPPPIPGVVFELEYKSTVRGTKET